MGISLQQYRLSIGLFSCSRFSKQTRDFKQKKESAKFKLTTSSIVRLLLLLSIVASILSFSTNTIIVNSSKLSRFTGSKLYSETDSLSKLRNYPYVQHDDHSPDPGGVLVLPVIDHNFWGRYINGNRNKGLKLCHWNIGGGFLKNKTEELNTVVADYSPHILGISEASFWSTHDPEDVQIPNYKIYFANTLKNPDLNVSRVAVFVHDDVLVTVRDDLMSTEVSSVWLEVGFPKQKKFLISHVYREWQYLGQNHQESHTVLEQLRRWDLFLQQWESAISENSEIHVQGDFNLNFLDFSKVDCLPSNTQSYRLKSLIQALKDRVVPNGFCQLINDVTRIWPGAPSTLLDHHWTNQEEKVSYHHAYYQGASDHKMIYTVRRTKKVISKPRIIKKRSFKNFDPQAFIDAVRSTPWLDVYLCNNLDTAVNLVATKLNMILDIMAPVKVIQVRSCYAPWMSSKTKEEIKKRKIAQQKAAESQNIEDWEEFKKLRNSINKTIKSEKKQWQSKKLETFGNDTRSIWKNVKNWLGWSSGGPPTKLVDNGKVYTKPKDISSILNNFFVTKVRKLRQNIPPSPGDPLALLRRLMKNQKCTMRLKSVHPDQVHKIISNLKSSSSSGLDSVDSRIIKLAKNQLVPVITHLVNLSITQTRFPSPWKVSKVIPIHKKDEVIHPKNYRPVSLLPVLSKVLERAVYEQVI